MTATDQMKVAVKPLEWQHDGNRSYAYCPVTDVRWIANNRQERERADKTRADRILSALAAMLSTPPAAQPVAVPYGYIVELQSSRVSYVIARSRVQPYLKVAEACVAEWSKLYPADRGWNSVIVPLYTTPPADAQAARIAELEAENERLARSVQHYKRLLTAARARIEELEGVLEPFAEAAVYHERALPPEKRVDAMPIGSALLLKHVRHARAALKGRTDV